MKPILFIIDGDAEQVETFLTLKDYAKEMKKYKEHPKHVWVSVIFDDNSREEWGIKEFLREGVVKQKKIDKEKIIRECKRKQKKEEKEEKERQKNMVKSKPETCHSCGQTLRTFCLSGSMPCDMEADIERELEAAIEYYWV